MASRINNGGLWHNHYKKAGDKRPDFVGEINIDGTIHKISAWRKSSSNPNSPSLSIIVNKPFTKPPNTPTPAKAIELPDNWEDDIPF